MSKITRLAGGAALIALGALAHRAYAPPATLLASVSVVLEEDVAVSITRFEPIRSLFDLLHDSDVRELAKEVQGFYEGKNYEEVTPQLLAQELLRSHSAADLMPPDVEYEYRKNVVTCDLEKYCIYTQDIIVSDPGTESMLVRTRVSTLLE
jgi:hypothetical protein